MDKGDGHVGGSDGLAGAILHVLAGCPLSFRGGPIPFFVARACRAAILRAAAPFLQICNA